MLLVLIEDGYKMYEIICIYVFLLLNFVKTSDFNKVSLIRLPVLLIVQPLKIFSLPTI